MTKTPNIFQPSTPEASAAVAQSREPSPTIATKIEPETTCAGRGIDFDIGPGVERAWYGQPYERQSDDPVYRPLKIFTLDPSVSRLEGSMALVNIPYEPLDLGPSGSIFKVEDYDESCGVNYYRKINLNDQAILICNGRDPSPSDQLFHQQMVYAVCSTLYAAFRSALGRHVAWGFDRQGDETQLRIRPHAFKGRNAEYRKETGELCFGYYQAEPKVAGLNLPSSIVFTCLSHDIIAHEVTHALLDGLRSHFTFPSGPDVLAFHEGFADLIAIFQHFSYDEVLKTAIRKSRGEMKKAKLLTDLARQFGHTTGSAHPLRSAVDETENPKLYNPGAEIHELGSVLVSAVFEAFDTVFKRKTERYIRLATNGSGVLQPGEPSQDLQAVLAHEASKLASQFLAICIRAIDYCPPVDLEFGEFLRAVITADRDLIPDDPWGYREAWIDAFQQCYIYPRGVANLSEDALLWEPPEQPIPLLDELSFAELKFEGDPARPAQASELKRQACALGRLITKPEYIESFGLVLPDDPRLGNDIVDLPYIQSIRSSRRVGADGQIVFDLIAEVTQRREVRSANGKPQFDLYGGSTVILDPKGKIRYVISKSVMRQDRLERQRKFLLNAGSKLWEEVDGKRTPKRQLFKLLHSEKHCPNC